MKKIYNYLLCIVIFICSATLVKAQTDDAKREKIEALRVAFISKRANFTPAEAQAFWPLYNEMNDKQEAFRKAFKQKYNNATNYNFENDKDAEAYLNAELTLKQKEYEIYKEYYEKFKKVLPVKKVAIIRRAEDDFKKEIIKSIKEN